MSEFSRFVWVVSGLTALAIAVFLTWLFIPERVNAKIVSIEWEYTANLRVREILHDAEWGRPDEKGFYNEPAFNVSCHSRFYGMEDCDPHPCNCDGRGVCSTCYNSCPEYRDWCEYDYNEWPVRSSRQTSGTDHKVYWPDLSVQGQNQRIQLIQEYRIKLNKTDESTSYEYNPSRLTEFQGFNVGEYWRLRVGKIRTHHVEELTRLQAEKN